MKYSKEYLLKNGKKISVRTLVESDAQILANYRIRLLIERGYTFDLNKINKETELEHIKKILGNDKILYLVADNLNNEIVGHVTIKLKSSMDQKSSCMFGVLKEYVGINVANFLGESIVEFANNHELIKEERLLACRNNKYVNAREEFNFQVLDKLSNSIHCITGKLADEIYMNVTYRRIEK